MKKCEKLLDYLESESKNDSRWGDLLAHSEKCPDCSTDLKNRKLILEELNNSKGLSYPKELHAFIMQGINNPPDSENLWFENLLERIIKPLQVIFTMASVFMIFSLSTLDNNQETAKRFKISKKARIEAAKEQKKMEEIASIKNPALEKVSEKEINEFLKKLENFKQKHPEAFDQRKILNPFDVRLVIDR